MIYLLISLIFLFASCNSISTVGDKDRKLTRKDTIVSSQDNKNDTSRIATGLKNLANRPLIEVANLILIDSILPMDDEVTFNCMDSLSSENSDTREFYFPVFKKIVNKSDGALSEIVGQYIMKYINKFPKEFAIKSKSLNEEEIKKWAFFVAYEMYFDYETPQKAQEWMRRIISNCIDCDSAQTEKLLEFNQLCISTMSEVADY